MKNVKQILCIALLTLAFTSCSLFNGGGSGGHCPAYGTSINNDMHQDINNSEELIESMSESI